MSFDDESDSPSPSSADYFESPTEAKRKALMLKLEKQGLKNDVKPGADLKQLKMTLLKGQLSKNDDKTKQQQPEKNAGKGGTKTREQEIASQKLTADTKPNAEQMVKQGSQDQKAEEQLKADEVQSEDA
jgi:hypothetical protein